MKRPFEFNFATLSQARFRQYGLCACCGEDLAELIEHGHHVIPNQSGTPGKAQHAWLATGDNCVVLCESCHARVHQDGRYRHGAVAPPSYYPHSHGRNQALHKHWAMELQRLARTVWG